MLYVVASDALHTSRRRMWCLPPLGEFRSIALRAHQALGEVSRILAEDRSDSTGNGLGRDVVSMPSAKDW